MNTSSNGTIVHERDGVVVTLHRSKQGNCYRGTIGGKYKRASLSGFITQFCVNIDRLDRRLVESVTHPRRVDGNMTMRQTDAVMSAAEEAMAIAFKAWKPPAAKSKVPRTTALLLREQIAREQHLIEKLKGNT